MARLRTVTGILIRTIVRASSTGTGLTTAIPTTALVWKFLAKELCENKAPFALYFTDIGYPAI